MRIWSKKLIDVLPTKQLCAMRYELGDMIKQHPNIKHSLVKFANNYDPIFLYYYFMDVCNEMNKRKINMKQSYNNEIMELICNKSSNQQSQIFKEDNNEYLTICYWNLYEKYIRGTISYEDWERIDNRYKEVINNEIN